MRIAAVHVVSSLLHKLDELLKVENKLLSKGVKKDLVFLHRDLRIMAVALVKIAEVPRDKLDEEVMLWADRFGELMYEMEDIVDSFLVRVEGSEPTDEPEGFKGLMKKMTNLFVKGKARHQIADAIKDMNGQLQEAADQRDRYRLNDVVAIPAATSTVEPRLSALYKDQTTIVGIEEAIDELIKRLTVGDSDVSKQQLKTLFICGFGGIGKTTLAKVVYNMLLSQFDCGAFVSVGLSPDLKRIFNEILHQLDKQRYVGDNAVMEEVELINELRELLQNKRYIIVIDDLWGIKQWEIISSALINSNCRSIIVGTTRNLNVAQRAGDVYMLRPLSREKSEELFYTRLFGGTHKRPYDQLHEVSKKILEKCAGLPLAIVSIAGLLAGTPRENWSTVYNSLGFGNPNVEGVMKILLTTYYDLPSYLKVCLLHLSIFPEDYLIRKDTLVGKWVAEGFVHEEPGIGLFELGERYFNELINRSLVQPIDIPHSGIIIGCRVHDLVVDMIRSLSAEENFVTVLDGNEQHLSSRNARWLAIQNKVLEERDTLSKTHLRSFHATVCQIRMMPSLSSFKFLRVLDMEGCTFMGGHLYRLEYLGRLLQLRYLGLPNMPICELPEEMGNLRFLQTLDLRQTKLRELPRSIGLLRQLMCLRANGGSIRVADWMTNLTSLEELLLNDVSESPNFVKELGKLTELRELKISIRLLDERSKKALVESLGSLQKMQALHLDNGGLWSEEDWEGHVPPRQLRHLSLRVKSSALPRWINSSLLPNLAHLSVDVRVVEAQDLEILGSLPELLTLKLFVPNVSLDVVGRGAFPKLRHWYASGMLRFLPGTAPSLEFVDFNVLLWDSNDGSFEFRSLGNLPLLQKVRVEIFYSAAHGAAEVEEVEAALRHVVDNHLNRPALVVSTYKSSFSEPDDDYEDEDDYDDESEDEDEEDQEEE